MILPPDAKESVRFLGVWCPGGPWTLTAISPTKGGDIETKTFTDLADAEIWVEARNAKYNLYFNVNPITNPKDKKASKLDVRGMAWLHVDVDPRVTENFDAERARIEKLLFTFDPPPTIIVDSGGGYQAFWKLEEEIPVNGDENRAIELEAYNLQLELLLGADSCHNLDRVMRLPDTVNLPNAKKSKAGRVPALAMVVREELWRVYPIKTFVPAQRVVQAFGGETGFTQADTVKISGNLARIDLDDLPDRVSQRTKMLIVQGTDPDDLAKYPSSSEVVFAVACEMVRGGCTDDQIASVLLDKDFRVSDHIYRQPRPHDYAARQIKRAHEDAISPELRKLNELHAVVEDIGGKCRVISEIFDPGLKRFRLSRQSFDDFRNRYMHIKVEAGKDEVGKTVYNQLGKFWLGHQNRRQYQTIVFAPGVETPGSYNLWRGFSCDPRPGSCDLYLQHIRENICGGIVEHSEYVLNWMARCLQQPDSPGEVAIVLRGLMGTGKGKFAKVFGNLLGRHFVHITDPKHLVGSFNSHLRDCVVLFADEAFHACDKKHTAILRGLITEETIMLEAKGIDAEVTSNFVHLIMASNEQWVVPAGNNERRFFVLDVGAAKIQDKKYFAAIDAEMKSGGNEALLFMLLNRDISAFEVRTVPKTEALNDQKKFSFTGARRIVYEMLESGNAPTGKVDKDRIFIVTSELKTASLPSRCTERALGLALAKASPQKESSREMCGSERKRGFWMPSLAEARRLWSINEKQDCRWPADDGEWTASEDSPPF